MIEIKFEEYMITYDVTNISAVCFETGTLYVE